MLLPVPEASLLVDVTSTNASRAAGQSSLPLPSISSHVLVPQSSFKLCAILEQALQIQVYPLGESSNYGKDIYLTFHLLWHNIHTFTS